MASQQSQARERRYCPCGTLLALDNTERLCARCTRATRDKLLAPPELPDEFWDTDQFRDAFAARHMGRISRIYRRHPHHHPVYGAAGIPQTLLGQWLGLRQPQISNFENGPPLQLLDTLQHWARTLRIPPALLWFRLPHDTTTDLTRHDDPVPPAQAATAAAAPADDPECDPVLVAPWNHRGTVEAVVVLSGGDRVRRRTFLSVTGPALTAPAHQWLIHEPEPLISGLSGHRISPRLAGRLTPMIAELRTMDDLAGGGSVLPLAQQHFSWVANLLDKATYDDTTGRTLHTALAQLGQFCGWAAYDSGNFGLAQRYNIAGLRAAHTADDRPLGAYILGSMAKQAAHQGNTTEAATLAETALAGVRGHETPRLMAQLHLRRAYASATLQNESACNGAISKARAQIEQIDSKDDPPWLYWVIPAWITVEAGDCLLRLEQPDQATPLLREGIALFDESFIRDRQLYTVHLADALARPGKQRDLDAAAGLGMQSLDLTENLESNTGTGHLNDLYYRMKPHAETPAVRDFLDRARELVQV